MSQTEVQLIKDAVIVNADVSNSAAIDVSKISGAMPLAGGTFTDDVTFTGANYNVSWDKSDNSLLVNDDARIKFGTGKDLHIYHNQSNSVIREEGTGNLNIQTTGGNVEILTNTTETSAKFISNGAVELYHDNTKRIETTSTGVTVTGGVAVTANISVGSDTGKLFLGASNDLEIFHNGNHSFITDSGTGNLFVKTNSFQLENAAGNETLISAVQDGAVELYHNGSKKLETTSDAVKITSSAHDGGLQLVAGNNNQETQFTLTGKASDGTEHAFKFNAKRSANRLDIVGGGTTRVSLLSTGEFGIGTAAQQSLLQVGGGTNPMSTKPTLHVAPSSGDAMMSLRGGSPTIYFDGTSGGHTKFLTDGTDLAISNGNIDANGTERFRFRADGGLCFNGDTAAANALDDYEEGTFTPAVTSGLSAGQIAYNSRSGHYTKIGRIVYFTFHINISSAVYDNGAFKFGGLPFTSVNDANQAGGMFKNYTTGNFSSTATFKVVGNSTDIAVITGAGDATAADTTSFNTNNRQVSFSGFYRI